MEKKAGEEPGALSLSHGRSRIKKVKNAEE
jgi:hypothetical protein